MWLLSSARLVLRRPGSSRWPFSQFFFASLKEATVASLLKCSCRFACHLGDQRSNRSHALRRNCPSSTLAGMFFLRSGGCGRQSACPRPEMLSCTPCASRAKLVTVFCLYSLLKYTHRNPSALTLLKLVDSLLGRAVSVGSIPMLRVRVQSGGPTCTVDRTALDSRIPVPSTTCVRCSPYTNGGLPL